jgi:hypothetical protein
MNSNISFPTWRNFRSQSMNYSFWSKYNFLFFAVPILFAMNNDINNTGVEGNEMNWFSRAGKYSTNKKNDDANYQCNYKSTYRMYSYFILSLFHSSFNNIHIFCSFY